MKSKKLKRMKINGDHWQIQCKYSQGKGLNGNDN